MTPKAEMAASAAKSGSAEKRAARLTKDGRPDGRGRPKGATKNTVETMLATCLGLWAALPAHIKASVPPEQRPVVPETGDEPDAMGGPTDDPAEFLRRQMRNPRLDPKLRLRAAERLLAMQSAAAKAGGKKQQKAERAQEAAGGGSKFAPTAPPPLKRAA